MNNKFNTNGAVPVILALGLLGCGSNSEDASSDQSTAAQEPSSHVPPPPLPVSLQACSNSTAVMATVATKLPRRPRATGSRRSMQSWQAKY